MHFCSGESHITRKQVVTILVCALFLIGPTQIAGAQTTEEPQQASPAPDSSTTQPAKTPPASPPPASDADKNQPATPRSGTEGIPAVVIDSSQAQGILGTQVRSRAGEDMGRIVDVIVDKQAVIVDKQAQVRGVVIDFGGFLGVGSRQIAVAWSAIRFSPQDKQEALVVDFTRDQLRAAPAYKSGEQIVLLGQPAAPSNPSTPGGTSNPSTPSNPTNPSSNTGTSNSSNAAASDASEKKTPAQ
jgi:PRC-barrel domain